MTKTMEEMILEELFKLSNKIDKMQEEMKNFATKDDLKRFATKEDLKRFATKDDLKELEERLNNKIKREAEDTAQIFKDAFGYAENKYQKMEERLNKKIDNKFESLPCQIRLNTVNSN